MISHLQRHPPSLLAIGEDPWVWPRAAYVHIPFCAHKCGYCDFASLAGSDHLAGRYLAALEREMATMGQPQEVDTIFIGGGTPTRLGADELELALLVEPSAAGFPLLRRRRSGPSKPTPGTLDAEEGRRLVRGEGGVNRVSLVRPNRLQPGRCSRPWSGNHAARRGGEGARAGPPALPALVVRPDLRRPRLDPRTPGRPTWKRALQLEFVPAHLSC